MPCWNVYVHQFAGSSIKVHNVFDHYRFVKDIAKTLQKFKDDRGTAIEEVRHNLMYYYWSKCEWEVIIDTWPPSPREDSGIKVDVYNQVKLNWDVFSDYVWEHRKDIISLHRRRERELKQQAKLSGR